MEIRIVDADELDEVGTALVADWLGPAPNATFMAALGTSPLGIYRGLAAMRAEGRLDTSRLTLVQLDEYLGIEPSDPRSLIGWLRRDVAGPLGIGDERIVRLAGDVSDPVAACSAYERLVAEAGGIDIAVLGLGPNGHLGFNEPPSDATARTRVVELAPASLASNARYWPGGTVPTSAITAGMDVILAARRTLLVVSGRSKAAVLHNLVEGPISPSTPASYLRRSPGVTLLADRQAWPANLALPAAIA
jgi:glucosamine-6-phosphate deaminase